MLSGRVELLDAVCERGVSVHEQILDQLSTLELVRARGLQERVRLDLDVTTRAPIRIDTNLAGLSATVNLDPTGLPVGR